VNRWYFFFSKRFRALFVRLENNELYLIFDYRTYGIYAPWITIAVVGSISAALLLYDWKRERKCFSHVTQPKELIRSETTEQMKKR